jgi:hypothetical protein
MIFRELVDWGFGFLDVTCGGIMEKSNNNM